MWSILSQGQRVVTSTVDGGRVMWLDLALSYLLLCRASEFWAYANGEVHPEFCLTRNCLTFLRGERQVAFENRSSANAVQVRFLASKTTRKERGARLPERECRVRRKSGVGRRELSKLCWSYSA